jgi:hypothetical protein
MNEQLVELHARILNKQIDSKTLSYWVNGLRTGALSLDSIRKTLLASDEYKSRVVTMFKQVYFELVGYENFDNVFRSFWNSLSNDEVTYNMIDTFVKQTAEYSKKITETIESSFAYANVECTSDEVAKYKIKFIENSKYTIDMLQTDINASISQDIPTTSSIIDNDKKDDKINIPKIVEKVLVNPEIDLLKLQMFENVFKRPMYVEEYFKYVFENPDVFSNLNKIFEKYQKQYTMTLSLYRDYSHQTITDRQFVSLYLEQYESENFQENLTDILLDTDEYKNSIKDVVLQWYKKLYDSVLNSDDLNYLYLNLRAQKCHLNDERLVQEIKKFKNQTDSFIEDIFATYMQVLQRQPDMYEIDQHVTFYRERMNQNMIDIHLKLECILINTLEFHEILKLKIREKYKTINSQEILPSKLYQCLNAVTIQIHNDTSLAVIDDILIKLTI